MSEARPDTTRSIGVAMVWLAVAASLLTAVVAASGGFRFDVAGMLVSIRTAARPLIAAIVFGVAGVIALRRAGAHLAGGTDSSALAPLLAGLSVRWGGWTRASWLRAIVFVVPPAIAAAALV